MALTVQPAYYLVPVVAKKAISVLEALKWDDWFNVINRHVLLGKQVIALLAEMKLAHAARCWVDSRLNEGRFHRLKLDWPLGTT